MSDVFYIKQGDRSPGLGAFCRFADGTAQDLTACTVVFSMRKRGTTTAKVSAASAVIVAAATGEVRYDWGTTDTDTNGTYDAEFEVTLGSGRKITFPNDGYLTVEVTDDIV